MSRGNTSKTPVLLPRRTFRDLPARERERESHHQLPSMLRPTLVPRIGRSLTLRPFRRSLHQVPPLAHDFSNEGIPGLLGPAGFDMAWTQYQSLMVEKLNSLTVGTLNSVHLQQSAGHRSQIQPAGSCSLCSPTQWLVTEQLH
jgi:hypothetical protein